MDALLVLAHASCDAVCMLMHPVCLFCKLLSHHVGQTSVLSVAGCMKVCQTFELMFDMDARQASWLDI